MKITKHQLAKATRFETPYYMIKGSSNGNTVMVTAGVHGNESASIIGAKKLVSHLQKNSLRINCGRLIIVPIVNQKAYKCHIRGIPDLNRTFPRNQHDKTASHPLSAAIFNLAKQFQPTWYIDLHEARGLSKLNPRVLGQTLITNPQSKAIPAVKRVIGHMNRSIVQESKHFTIRLQKLPGSARTAANNLLNARAITVETSCVLPKAVRANLQMRIVRHFLKEAGLI